ncbi:hypothetical protein [Cellulomonas aerilata]|uniref:Uncharacterized protein n=1 Tax=Cellulomonas aerilata TaxID=515326 RepID=A0A512DCG1_9CELL|nr:hypothetical protein [Cellulomonas aerilata]GEO34171.1 hypothetical protein CAE01nite_18960 [Cellulomonas aerilata]
MNDVPDADPTASTGDPRPSEPDDGPVPEQVMDLLADHVPLALLMDLVTPDGPDSADILAAEGMPDDAWWEPGVDDGTSRGRSTDGLPGP